MSVPSLSPIKNLIDAPPICPECSDKMRVVPEQAVKGKLRSYLVSCDQCKYSTVISVEFHNAQQTRYAPPPLEEKPAEVKS